METFDIIEYLSGLTTYVFDKAVLKRVALERGVSRVTDFGELDKRTKDLLYADLLFAIYTSPNSSASISMKHGDFSQSIGSQTINDKRSIYNVMVSIYSKWNDDKIAEVENLDGGLSWLE